MLNALARNGSLVGALVVGSVICGASAGLLLAPRGGVAAGVLQASSVPAALGAMLLSLAVSVLLAILVARLANTAVGMFVFGGSLFGLAWRSGTIVDVAFDGSLGLLGAETLLWAILIGTATWLVFRLGGPMQDVEPREDGTVPDALLSADALKLVLSGALVLPVVMLLAKSPLKGQAIGAVAIGAMVVGLAGRMIVPHVQPILLFAAPLLFGALGQFVGALLVDGPTDASFVAGTIPAVCLPMPIDYAAGSLMGVAMGLGWAKSFLHNKA